ncbi:MAG: hypothetical protein HOP35_11220 [Nitrospira sp.]|nr:hypothetical protein [Nitrospira sp.]
MSKDFVLCARAVEQNKFLSEPGPSFSLLAPRNIFSPSEQPNWFLTHLHNRKTIGESIQDQHSIYLDSPDELTTERNLIIHKKSTIAHDGTCFAK